MICVKDEDDKQTTQTENSQIQRLIHNICIFFFNSEFTMNQTMISSFLRAGGETPRPVLAHLQLLSPCNDLIKMTHVFLLPMSNLLNTVHTSCLLIS